MKRLVLGLVGTVLLWAPGWWLFPVLVPVPQYRTGAFFTDYAAAIATYLALYGGAASGILVLWWGNGRSRTISSGRVVLVGFLGAVGMLTVVLLGQPVARWVTTGRAFPVGTSFALVPIVALFAVGLSAVVAAGAGLVWSARGVSKPQVG
jgi:hypothetical protein